MFLIDLVGAVLSPIHVVGRRLYTRVGRAFSFRAVGRRRYRPKRDFTLPVIEYSQLSSLYFAIEQATHDDTGYDDPEKVVDVWLRCVLTAQYLSDRLLMDIRAVEVHMNFWQKRLKSGNNEAFMAFGQGPIRFVRAMVKAFKTATGLAGTDIQLQASHRIEQRVVTLRTMHHILCAVLARLHRVSVPLRITPDMEEGAAAGGLGPAERVDGSTARTVAAVAAAFAEELLASVGALEDLQRQLDAQQEGVINVRVSTKPVLMAPDNIPITPIPPLCLDSVYEVPGQLAHADATLTRVLETLHAASLRLGWAGDPVAGVRHATAAADAEASGVVHMPPFARSPNRVQRHWLAYSLNTLAVCAAARFLYVNSRLNGSDNLRNWVSHGYMATVRGFRDNVIRPLTNVREEFFDTFTARAAYSDSTRDDFEAGKRSLTRMLADFEADVTRAGFRADGEDSPMGVLLSHYEQELKHPIRNAVTGTLPRSLLIQVHKMKTDTEAAMIELDKIMKSNELTLAVTAAFPAIVVAGTLGYAGLRLLSPPPPNVRTTAGPIRVAMAELERAIDMAVSIEESPALSGLDTATVSHGPSTAGSHGAADGAALSSEQSAALHALQHRRGVILVDVAKLRATAERVYALSTRSLTGAGDTATWAAEWKNLDADLLDMAAAGTAARQARIASRMHRTYLVFRA
eukprot:jgi/Ulvmu1/11130/UM071_0013.1